MSTIELIGFSDASSNYQAAVIYSRIKSGDKYIIRLMAAKGNVTKIKTPQVLESKEQTIPKLELQAIVTLVTLYDSIKTCIQHKHIKFTAYTDSMIALSWVRTNNAGQKYIRRNVEKIRRIINSDQINYVSTHENPADVASRGLKPDKLVKCDLYYNGPEWLQNDVLPSTVSNSKVDKTTCLLTMKEDSYDDIFGKFSNFMFLIRVVALILRWKHYKKSASGCYERYLNPMDEKLYFRFNANEISCAKQEIIKYYQRMHFKSIITNLKTKILNPVPKGHWLYKLSPFLDENEIIRVGGRLNYADVPAYLKHPIAIPQSHLKSLIVSYYHLSNFHAGNSLMLRLINETYWIPALRTSIHHFIQRCAVCTRWRNQRVQPQMAHLPSVRVNRAQPFDNCGVDLAGPFEIKSSTLRKAQIIKIWIVTFVCMSTKALHLEITSSLDTEHFLAAFDRFTSRRGVPRQVWSDNGRNFIGANRLLTEAWHRLSLECQSILAIQEIKWVFIPRYSPSFGGLWEASVKSIKYFTQRMKDIRNLTFEEFSTLLCKIEALLNSRPITTNPISPFEEAPLTPFHFLTQKGMTADSISATGVINSPLKKKWLEIVKIQHHLWRRFQTEYLTQLQKKAKWIRSDRELSKGEIVLISDNNTAPGEWKMGKIVKTHKDFQGVSRKADVQNADGKVIVESVRNLIPLNILDMDEKLPRNTTTYHKNSVTPTQVLLVWLACTSGATAFNVTSLSPGIHIFPLGDVYTKALSLDFTVETGYNVTADIAAINYQKIKFDEFCTQTEFPVVIKTHCTNMMKIVDIEVSEMLESITAMFQKSSKPRRYVQLARWGAKASKFALKHSPEILLTAGAVWQAHEISTLEEKMEEANKRTKEITHTVLTILKTEEKDLETNLKNLKTKQDEEELLTNINTYSTALNTLLHTIGDRYNQLRNFNPNETLHAYLQKLHQDTNYENLILPNIKNIFSDFTYKINDDMVLITYNIPLVHKTAQEKKLVILSIPTRDGESIKLPNGKNIIYLILNSNQTEYAIINEREIVIYENIDWIPTDKCLSTILKQNVHSVTDICPMVSNNTQTNAIIQIQGNWAVIHSNNQTLVVCGDHHLKFEEPYLLVELTSNCTFQVDDMTIGHIQGSEDLTNFRNIPDLTVPIVKPADIVLHKKLINKLIQKVEDVEENEQTSIKNLNWTFICIILVICLTIIIFLCYCRKVWQSKTTDLRWFPDWTGPTLEMR